MNPIPKYTDLGCSDDYYGINNTKLMKYKIPVKSKYT